MTPRETAARLTPAQRRVLRGLEAGCWRAAEEVLVWGDLRGWWAPIAVLTECGLARCDGTYGILTRKGALVRAALDEVRP